MNDWFTVEQVDPQTFVLSEYGHWEETHCYLLCGNESALLIDTGLGVSNIRAVVSRLTTLPVLAVTTRAHWDHIGGHRYFCANCSSSSGKGLAVRSVSAPASGR